MEKTPLSPLGFKKFTQGVFGVIILQQYESLFSSSFFLTDANQSTSLKTGVLLLIGLGIVDLVQVFDYRVGKK